MILPVFEVIAGRGNRVGSQDSRNVCEPIEQLFIIQTSRFSAGGLYYYSVAGVCVGDLLFFIVAHLWILIDPSAGRHLPPRHNARL